MKNALYLLFVLMCCAAGLQAQDFTFSQYQSLPYLLNPAETGNFPGRATHRVGGIFRSQWDHFSERGIYGSALGWDWRPCNRFSDYAVWSFGLFVQHDGVYGSGLYNLNGRALVSLSHTFIGDSWVAYGLSVGALQYGLSPEKYTFNEQFDGTTGDFSLDLPSGENTLRDNRLVKDMDFGVRIFDAFDRTDDADNGWTLGFSLHHLLRPSYSLLGAGKDENTNRLDPGFSVQGAVRAFEHWQLNGFYRRQSYATSKQWQLVAGTAFIQELSGNDYSLGAQLRLSGKDVAGESRVRPGLVLLVKADFGPCFVRGSWDSNLSSVSISPPGSFELSAVWLMGKRRCPMNCPGFTL